MINVPPTRRYGWAALALVSFVGGTASAAETYREPPALVTRLLTGAPPPVPLVHSGSRRVALLHRQPLVPLSWLARPYLGLAGYRFDPETRSSRGETLVARVEVVTLGENGAADVTVAWQPPAGTHFESVSFSPDGRHLAATAVSSGPAQMVIFDIAAGRQRSLPVAINAAWGAPCRWVTPEALLCRLLPKGLGAPPPERPVPVIIEHFGAPAPARTYRDLLEDSTEDALFEHYYDVELARVTLDGTVRRVPGARGLLADFQPSPDGKLAVTTRIVRPYSRLLPASRFPRSVELWDLDANRILGAHALASGSPWRVAWQPGTATTLGWIEEDLANGTRHWMVHDPLQPEPPREIVSSQRPIENFGWTTAGTPYFRSRSEDGTRAHVFRVIDGRAEEIWSAKTEDRYGNPGRLLDADGTQGAVLEIDGRVFLAGDGLGAGGPEPYLVALDLRNGETQSLFVSRKGVFESVIAAFSISPLWIVTSRETETETPRLFSLRVTDRRETERHAIRPGPGLYPELAGVERRTLSYKRNDGVTLGATLYLPAGAAGRGPLPTLLWIYPREYTERDYAEQVDVRNYRFPEIKGPSPLAAALAGYAVVLNPTMPIVGSAASVNDEYITQLVASAEAVVEHLVSTGVSDPDRIAVGGRSYGAFSSANLLVHTQLFRTAIAMSGAYNRTLTPFGFQHEKRTFWKDAQLYARISPFLYADSVDEPLLLVHGGADSNPGTPPEQSRRFFRALIGNGAAARLVELPYEDHQYVARESVLHAAAEMLDWLDRTIGPDAPMRATPLPTAEPDGGRATIE